MKFEQINLEKFRSDEITDEQKAAVIGGRATTHWANGDHTYDTLNNAESRLENGNYPRQDITKGEAVKTN